MEPGFQTNQQQTSLYICSFDLIVLKYREKKISLVLVLSRRFVSLFIVSVLHRGWQEVNFCGETWVKFIEIVISKEGTNWTVRIDGCQNQFKKLLN